VTIKVVLADDQALVRAGFRALLDDQDDMQVVGEAGDGNDAVLARVQRPDQTPNCAAFAGSIPTFEEHNDGNPGS